MTCKENCSCELHARPTPAARPVGPTCIHGSLGPCVTCARDIRELDAGRLPPPAPPVGPTVDDDPECMTCGKPLSDHRIGGHIYEPDFAAIRAEATRAEHARCVSVMDWYDRIGRNIVETAAECLKRHGPGGAPSGTGGETP